MNECPPPDPNTRSPDFKPPANSCDSHCHVFGPADKFPYAPTTTALPPDAPVATLRALHDTLGIDRAVLVQPSCHGTDNGATLDAIASSGGRYMGVAMVDQSFTDADYEKLHEGGIRGVRFTFVGHLGGAPDMSRFNTVVEHLRPLGWHLVLHIDARDLIEHGDLLRRVDVPVIVDHMGRVATGDGVEQAPFRALVEFVRDHGWWVKITGAERNSTAGPPFTDAVPFAQALIEAAPDRVIWGTDWPHPNLTSHMPNDGDLVDLLPLYAPDETTRRKILVDNPARLYGFDA